MSPVNNNVVNLNTEPRIIGEIGGIEMQPVQPVFYVYGSSPNAEPLDEGTALYCRLKMFDSGGAFLAERDFKWDKGLDSWVPSEYLGRLLSRGEPTLDMVHESQLPDWINWPVWK